MYKRILVLLVVLQIQISAQENFINYYANGAIKLIARKTGQDTVEFKSYYSSGEIRDSLTVKVANGKHKYIGVSKHYYKQGQMAAIFYYDNALGQNLEYREKREYYRNGVLKYHGINKGFDTLEFFSYHKNGKLRDSIWYIFTAKGSKPIGVSKYYHDNGRLGEIAIHGETNRETSFTDYYKNGSIEKIVQRPGGTIKFYNKRGIQKREFNENYGKEIYVPKKFRKGRYFSHLFYAGNISTNKAFLVNNKSRLTLKAGKLVTIQLKNDTNLLNLCLIEGFSRDSVYITKLNYNSLFKKRRGEPILKADSCFVLGLNQMDKIYYTKHGGSRRHFGAMLAELGGYEIMILIPLEFGIFAAMGAVDWQSAIGVSGIGIAIGLPLVYYGKYLYKTAIPKKYDLSLWKLEVKK